MPNLFLIDGASGTGKSDLLEFCSTDANSAFIAKYTNKDPDNDGVKRKDLKYKNKQEYDELVHAHYQNFFEYAYPRGSTVKYLILKSELDEALRNNTNVFVIIRDIKVIEQIKNAYAQFININIVTVFLYCDRTVVENRIKLQCRKEGISDAHEIEEKVNRRLERDVPVVGDYINNVGNKVYDHVILNVENHDMFHACITNLIDSYKFFDDKFFKCKAFVIMPFTAGREWTHFNHVKEAIAAGALKQGFIAERQDDKDNGSQEIMNDIKASIKESIICIGDLTLARPNCYYELGLAEEQHSLDAIILIKEKTEEKDSMVHFDMLGRNVELYTFTRGNYDDISSIVSQKIKAYKDKHIFITKRMKQKNPKL